MPNSRANDVTLAVSFYDQEPRSPAVICTSSFNGIDGNRTDGLDKHAKIIH